MVEKVIRIRVCNFPECPTPQDDVKRVEISIEKAHSQVDVCAGHRDSASINELVANAHKRGRRRGIRVMNPEDIPTPR